MAKVLNELSYFHKKYLTRTQMCPVCGESMKLNTKTKMWKCQNCDFSLDENYFKNGDILCFCEHCGSFLNNQVNFNINSASYKCAECGHSYNIPETIKELKCIKETELKNKAKLALADLGMLFLKECLERIPELFEDENIEYDTFDYGDQSLTNFNYLLSIDENELELFRDSTNTRVMIDTKSGISNINGERDGIHYSTTVKNDINGFNKRTSKVKANLSGEDLTSQVKELRKQGVTQQEIANMTGVSQSTVSRHSRK